MLTIYTDTKSPNSPNLPTMRAQNTILSYMLCLLAALTPIIAALSPVIAALSPVSVIPSPFSAALSPVPDTLTPVPDTRTPVPDTLTPAPAALSLAPAALSPALENGEVIIVSPPAAPLPPTDEILVVLDDSDTDDSDSGDSDSEFEETVVLGSSFFAPSLAELLTPAVSAARVSPLSTGEATRICRSPAWALTPENWIFSGAKEYLEAYTAATEGAYARKKFGLVGSLAYHYLGEENFRCDIGSKTCAVSCKDVAMAVEDLEEAQLVYFVLSSVSHFAAVANLVHVSISSSLYLLSILFCITSTTSYINTNYSTVIGCSRHWTKQCRTHGTKDGVLVFLASGS